MSDNIEETAQLVGETVVDIAEQTGEAVVNGANQVVNGVNNAINSEQAQNAMNQGANMANQGAQQAVAFTQQGANMANQGAQQAGALANQGAQQAGALANQGANMANQGAQQAGALANQGAQQAGALAQQGVNKVQGAYNSEQAQQARNQATNLANQGANQASALGQQGIELAKVGGNMAVGAGKQIGIGINNAISSEEAQRLKEIALAGGEEAQALAAQGLAALKNVPVPQINFDAEAAKKTFAAGGAMVVAFAVDIMKLEIVRDFFQFIGIMVDSIKFPVVFRNSFGIIGGFLNASFSVLFANVKALTPFNWFLIMAFLAIIPWCILIGKMRKDLNLDTKFAATREAKKKLSWAYRNEKNPWEGKFIKILIIACTTLYSPVTRNCLQMMLKANKYFAGTYTCADGKTTFQSNAARQSTLAPYHCGESVNGTTLTTNPSVPDDNYGAMAALSAIIFIGFTLYMPYKLGQVILNLKPKFIAPDDPEHPFAEPPPANATKKQKDDYEKMHGKPVWFNDEGEVEVFTDELYAVAVRKAGSNPYVSLYSGYEQNWSRYKMFVMNMKLLQMIPTILLTSHYMEKFAMPESDSAAANQALLQSIASTIVMILFAGLSFKAAPFIDRTNDKMDQVSRVVLIVTPLLMVLAAVASGAESAFGIIMTIVNIINLCFMVYFNVSNLPAVKKIVKKMTGKLEFSDPNGGPVPFQPNDNEMIPDYNLNDERRRRIWKPFWDNLFNTDPLLANTQVAAPDAEEEKKKKKKKKRPTMKGPGDIQIVYPQDRLEETIDKLHHRGRLAFESGLMPLSSQDIDIRLKIQSQLEGPDVYCTDQWQTVPGKSICKDGHMDSKTCFGRLEIDVYPYSALFFWDDCKDYGEIFSWSQKANRLIELWNKNCEPQIRDKRQVRELVRGMAKSGQQYYLVQHRTTTKKVEDGKDSEGNTKYKTITINWTYENGTVAVSTSFGTSPWEQGFNVSMTYHDGQGIGSDGSRHGPDTHTFGASDMGLTTGYTRTARFNELMSNSNNAQKAQAGMQQYLQELNQYRQNLANERMMTSWSLSWGFWYWIYNNDVISYQRLLQYFNGPAEQNPVVRGIPQRHQSDLQMVYSMMNFFNTSPIFGFWYTFWADIWIHNQDVQLIADNADIFDKSHPTSLCFRPMPRVDLEKILKEKNDPLGKKQTEYLDAFFAKIGAIAQGYGVATFGQPVVQANAIPVVHGIPVNPKLKQQLKGFTPGQQ